jgi:hypothetical protein
MTPLRFAAGTCLSVLVLAPTARADTKSARAEELFEEGRRAMATGDFATACPKFAESLAIEPAAGTALNEAVCYEKAEKLASAWAAFRSAEGFAQAANEPARARAAGKNATRLESKLSHLTLSVAASAQLPGLEVRCDDDVVRAPEWGAAVPRDGGGHDIQATAPGRKTWRTHVELKASGQNLTVEVPLLEAEPQPAPPVAVAPPPATAVPSPTPPEVPPPSSDGKTQKIVAYSVGAFGIVAVGFGAFAGLHAKSVYDQALRECGNSTVCASSDAHSERGSAGTWATVSTIGFVAGGAALATGVILYFTAHHAPGSAGSALAIAPTPDGARVSLGGAF